MKRLIFYLSIGIIASNLLSSCEKDVDDGNGYPPEHASCNIRNAGNDSIHIVWYYKDGDRIDTVSISAKSDAEINPNYCYKPSLNFDSISISYNSNKVTYRPISVENVEYPSIFSFHEDKEKYKENCAYYYCTLSESSLSEIANEMEKHGQNVWRNK